MSEAKKDNKPATLFFVKNKSHNFAPVEKFLKKRGYNVIVETDVKTAMDRIIAEKPDYVFLSWDHKNENIRHMPKAIYQTCTAQVVPFIMSTHREQIIQLESSGFENRLYPPLSGPAIIRVISKYEKKNQIFEQINAKKTANAGKESDTIKVKSFVNPEANNSTNINVKNGSRGKLNMFVANKKRKGFNLGLTVQEGIRAKLLKMIEEELSKMASVSIDQKETVKKNVSEAFNDKFTKEGSKEKLLLAIEEEIAKLGELTEIEQKETTGKLIELTEAEIAAALKMAEVNDASPEPMSELLTREIKPLNTGQINFLDQTFTDTIKPELFEVIETYADQATNPIDLTATTQIYVLVVQELEWTGYLTIASENYLDIGSAQVIFSNWIKQMIRIQQIDQAEPDQSEMPDSLLFEIRVPKVDYTDLCSYKSEFFKEIDFQGKKTMLGFFSFSPYQVINSVHEAFDMLELPTEFLQPNKDLPFDINLYLPENKKFILYLRPGSFLDDAQVSRLQTRKVKYIFSNMDYETALIKYKAEFNLNNLIAQYTRIKASKT